jgi:hypothetical protein
MPIVGVGVGTEPDEVTRRKLAVDYVGARQARNTEKGRNLAMIAQSETDIEDTLVNFPLHQVRG